MSEEIKKLIEAVGTDFEAFKKDNNDRIAAVEKRGYSDPLLNEKVDKTAAAILNMEDRLTQLHAALARSGVEKSSPSEDGYFSDSSSGVEYTKAHRQYLRKGMENGLNDMQIKALSIGSDPDGGYLVTPETNSRVISKVFESSPLRDLCTVETITSSSYELYVDDDEFEALSGTELSARVETSTARIRKLEISVHDMYAMPKTSQRNLDDSKWNVEEWIGRKLGEKFGRKEATWGFLGNGVDEMRGIMTYPAGTGWGQIEQINSGSAAAITADGLIDLAVALKEPYQAGATYLMKRSTAGAVMKLKNGQNDYLWKQSLRDGQPQTLNGYPLRYADDIAAVSANSLSVVFGNFRDAYTIVDRFGVRVFRDVITYRPSVAFYSTKRVGGGVVNFEALKIQKIAA